MTGDNPFANLSAIERLSKVHIHHKNEIILILIACLWVQDRNILNKIFKRCSKLAIDQNSSEYLTYFFKRSIFKIENYNLNKYFKIRKL